MIPIQQINEAYERTVKSDVHYRFVIDIASLKQSRAATALVAVYKALGGGWQSIADDSSRTQTR